jgi:hypothetical protein
MVSKKEIKEEMKRRKRSKRNKKRREAKQEREEAQKEKRWFFIGLIIIAIVLFSYLWFSGPIETKVIEVKFEVGDSLGITADDALNFGKIPAGSSSIKTANLENSYQFPLAVSVLVSQEIKDFVFIKQDAIIQPGKLSSLPIKLVLPDNLEAGHYSGKIKFEFRKAS